MLNGVQINPACLYDDTFLFSKLQFPIGTVQRARREGRLRHTKVGGRFVYFGCWILSWLGLSDVTSVTTPAPTGETVPLADVPTQAPPAALTAG